MVKANDSPTENPNAKLNSALLSALCTHLSLDPNKFSKESFEGHDMKSLVLNALQLSGKDVSLVKDEVTKWITFANNFLEQTGSRHAIIKGFNEDLTQRSVLLDDGFRPSEADVIVFSVLHSFVIGLSTSDIKKIPNVMRWIDYIQNKEDFGVVFKKIPVEKTKFEPHGSHNKDKLEVDAKSNKSVVEVVKESKEKESKEKDENTKILGREIKKVDEKKRIPEKESVEKDTGTTVAVLNILVGVIRKAWKHPSADSLLVEEIDLGDGNSRQVVSGLAKYFSPDDLMNRHVLVVANVKPGKLRDVMSSGLVLCASNEDHTVVEPLLPPEGAKVGERVAFAGYEGKPEDVLNPKKKQLEKITPHLYTDDKGLATFKGIPFMTSAGPCTSSILQASIK